MSRIIKVGMDTASDIEAIDECLEFILKGGVIAYPTETFYGLGVNAYDKKAVEKIFELKGRSPDKPLLILIGHKEQLYELIERPIFSFEKLTDRFWPGPLTIVFKASQNLPDILHGNTGKIGVRISGHSLARDLPLRAKLPITSTSANISGKPVLKSAFDIKSEWDDRIDLILDGGILTESRGSTIVDISKNRPLLIREGDIPFEEIKRIVD